MQSEEGRVQEPSKLYLLVITVTLTSELCVTLRPRSALNLSAGFFSLLKITTLNLDYTLLEVMIWKGQQFSKLFMAKLSKGCATKLLRRW